MRSDLSGAWRAVVRAERPLVLHRKYELLEEITAALQAWRLPPGDYLEFGVYRGSCFISAYKLATRKRLPMRFYAFDSFEGLPEPDDVESGYNHFSAGQYACSQNEFRSILKKARVNLDRVTLIPGFFETSLRSDEVRSLPIKRIAVAWVDCDLYSSTVPVLEYLTPLLTSGSVLVFDDWFSFGGDPAAGELRAVREWLVRNPNIQLIEYRKFGISGIAFLVQRIGAQEPRTDRKTAV